jgi:hypothetical protein
MKKNRNYFLFIKISEETFIDSLQKKGHIYCNTIKYFRTIEDNNLRGDENEGKAFIKQMKNIHLKLGNEKIIKAESGQMFYEHPNDKGNIFCLYGVESELYNPSVETSQKIKIEFQTKDFGKSALIIHNPKEFFKRIKRELNKRNKEFNFSPVNYYDTKTYEGELSPFYKSNKYSYQNEIRLWIPNEIEKPYEFFIGDISDISYKAPVEDLDKIEVQIIKTSS